MRDKTTYSQSEERLLFTSMILLDILRQMRHHLVSSHEQPLFDGSNVPVSAEVLRDLDTLIADVESAEDTPIPRSEEGKKRAAQQAEDFRRRLGVLLGKINQSGALPAHLFFGQKPQSPGMWGIWARPEVENPPAFDENASDEALVDTILERLEAAREQIPEEDLNAMVYPAFGDD